MIIETSIAGFGSGSDECTDNGCNVLIETEKDGQRNHKDQSAVSSECDLGQICKSDDTIQRKNGKNRLNKSAKEKKPHFKLNFKSKLKNLQKKADKNAELQNRKISEIIHVFPNISTKIPKKKKNSETFQSTSPAIELTDPQDNVSQIQLSNSPDSILTHCRFTCFFESLPHKLSSRLI